MARSLQVLVALWLSAWLLPAAAAQATSTSVVTLTQAQVAQGTPDSTTPPADGWLDVPLMDYWDLRWPEHNGVVWYRLHWHQDDNASPIGLLVSYACMAQAVYVNGSLVYADSNLTEPLSRSWIRPHYFLIDQPLLHKGDNEIWIRVSGIVAYQPGLGAVSVGSPRAVQALYRSELFWRYGLHLFSQAIDAVFCGLFLILWLLRRKDTAFGWYALTSLISLCYNANFIADSTWPFASTDAWQAFILSAFVANASVYCVFLLRFCERRWRWTEYALLGVALAQIAWAIASPHSAGVNRGLGFVVGSLINLAATVWFIGFAVQERRWDLRVLAACLVIPCAAGVHDFLALFGITHSDNYLLAVTAPLSLIGMGFALAFRFAAAMRRVEGFNAELRHEVDEATDKLRATLSREHQLNLTHTRTSERLNLVRDIHDGFGGSLLNTITVLEMSPHSEEQQHAVAALKELRDDLRLVIDTSAHDHDTDLPGLLAPLRHRWSTRLEIAGMEDLWAFARLEGIHPIPGHALDLLRFLQELLTNVLKHSNAEHVEIVVERRDERRLLVGVRDDGRGFEINDPMLHRGAGLNSLRSRAIRLGGELTVESRLGRGAWVGMVVSMAGWQQRPVGDESSAHASPASTTIAPA
ncbi:sensor histidine kinase [Luteibacter aegosomatissinici]|uniref:sensor histidine kinase n=1 Tax=Luteibacter aegosomatissinici TaxID=2911539 RepID=UPI001FFB66E4|nr:ATP-binding protein [Luteibacter aegosomatissinici]UPG93852.1 hypothetical protein L2Y97_18750 [Luteibacter aegosomatissinici]